MTLARRVVLLALVLAAAVYVAAGAWLVTQETRLVFRAGRALGSARPALPFEQIDLPRADGARQFAWVMRQPANPGAAGLPRRFVRRSRGEGGSGGRGGREGGWALFLHGNAATIASRMNILHYEHLRALGLNVLAPEYRGYAGLEGVPSERSLYADARAAYDYMRDRLDVPPERLAIYGWSLGGAVAVDLAAQVPHAALILEGAPASVVDIGQQLYPLFPVRLLMRNPFDAVLKIGRIQSPILFLHSRDDDIVPLSEGRRLFAAATAPKTFVELNGGHVDAVRADPGAFLGAVGTLLDAVDLRVPSPGDSVSRGKQEIRRSGGKDPY